MPEIIHPQAVPPGVPRENVFHAIDETGMKLGSATVVEFFNDALLPERPLNYYVTMRAMEDRAFDMLMGAAYARAYSLWIQHPGAAARMYIPCKPTDAALLHSLQAYGLANDDAEIRMRRFLSATDVIPQPPVGCVVSPVILEDEVDAEGLVSRLNHHSVTARTVEWVQRLQQDPFFQVLGVWQDSRLLGEAVVTAYGSEGRIEAIYTHPPFQRRGVAQALVGRAGQMLAEGGARTLNVEVWRRNTGAMAFFQAMRFDSVSPVILYPGVNWG